MHKHRTSLQTTTGWGRLEYTGWIDESLSWKQTCYIGDWSFLDELHVAGPDALKLFSDFAVNGFSRFAIGQAKHIICCSQQGKVIGEGILVRLAEETFEFQALGPVSNWLEFNCRKGRYDAVATLGSSKFKYQVSGPTSLFLLEKLTGESLRGIGFMHTQKLRIAGHGVVFLRQGMAGEVGFEVQGPKQHAREVMGTILSVGQEFGIRRLGDRTAMINHLEACFPTVTHDYIPPSAGRRSAISIRRWRAAPSQPGPTAAGRCGASTVASRSRAASRPTTSAPGIAVPSSWAGSGTSSSTIHSTGARRWRRKSPTPGGRS